MSNHRARWAAVGAAVAITLGAGGLGVVNAVQSSGERGVYTAIEPCRLVDTRPGEGIGGRTSPLGPEENYQLQGTGNNGECTGIPTDAIALALNVTPVGPTLPTNLRFFPGGPVPNASSLNPAPGQPPTPNAVTVDLAGDGSFRVYNFQGQVHLIADVVGYYRDHNHDDRYYTKGQSNDRHYTKDQSNSRYYTKGQTGNQIAAALATQPWSESMPVSAAFFYNDASAGQTWTVASGGSSGPDGITFNNTNSGRFFHGFTLPPQYQAGTDAKIRISWVADTDNTPGCTFRMEDNGTSAARPGQAKISPPTQFVDGPAVGGGSFPYVILTATNEGSPSSYADNVIRSAELIVTGADLQPGDQIETAIMRRPSPTNPSHDSCTGGLTIVGLTAESA